METNKNKEIEKILAVADHMQGAEMPAFFYTRLKARMENDLVANPKFNWILKPSFSIPLIAVVLMINVFTVGQLLQKNTDSQSSVESFQSEYNLNSDYGLEIY